MSDTTIDFFGDWNADDGHFFGDFLPFTHTKFVGSGLKLFVSMQNCEKALEEWREYCREWIVNDMHPQGGTDLNHKKKSAALYYFLISNKVVTVFKAPQKRSDLIPNQMDFEQIGDCSNRSQLKKLLGGDTAFICFLYIYNICEYYERQRDDKVDLYESRITECFERDFIKLVLTEAPSPKSIHIIFKALFLRD